MAVYDIYQAPNRDYKFVMQELFDIGEISREIPEYRDATPDIYEAMIEEGGKFLMENFLPLNQQGDRQGCTYENGVVRTPEGFKEAYHAYSEMGFTGMSNDPKWGGQGLPHSLQFAIEEMVVSTNMSLGTYAGLTGGAFNAINASASEELKDIYLPKMCNGEWSGAMCLTEPHCGTDLGLIKTKAEPLDDGSYAITGTKIFITGGEQDITDNIVHLVLAKIPGGPEGVKGISLFLVPKFLPDENGEVGQRNNVKCGSIEDKMGLKGSATCVMNFDAAKGWLVGPENKGMRGMFIMMNAARMGVGIQGLGILETSYQSAFGYAKERLQGRSLSGTQSPDKAADSILVHPDVRRMLLRIKANTEGGRAMATWLSMSLDKSMKHPDPQVRQDADDLVQLMTPILKAYLTDSASEAANLGVQTMGGHGFIKEWGMEQLVRDSRIAQLYEGTNGIQALDLTGRKLGAHFGRYLRSFFHPVAAFLEENKANTALAEFSGPLQKVVGTLQQTTAMLAQKGMKDPEEIGAASSDYLKLFAHTAMAFLWARSAKVALEKLADDATEDKGYYEAKLHTARFFMQRMLPEAIAAAKMIQAGKDSLMDMPEDLFLAA